MSENRNKLKAIPIGIYQDKKGNKHVLILGLLAALLGLVIPIFGGLKQYYVFLITVLLLGGGAAILQVAGNPIMRDVSREGKYSRNLSCLLGCTFNNPCHLVVYKH